MARLAAALVAVWLALGCLTAPRPAPGQPQGPRRPPGGVHLLVGPPAAPPPVAPPTAGRSTRGAQAPAFVLAPNGAKGVASWYPASGLVASAGPPLRVGAWRGRAVRVCLAGDAPAPRCVVVRLEGWCACVVDGVVRLVDLGDDAFSRLAPLPTGLVRVAVSW